MIAWWSQSPKPGNLGDVLTPIILQGMGVDVKWAPRRKARLLAIGSIIRFAVPGQYVWGSGAMWSHDVPSPRARYLAVRGPLTRAVVQRAGGECPQVYGDPALLLPRIHNGAVEQQHDVAIVPHYVDERGVRARYPGWHIISSLRANPLQVVDEIRSCKAILSSSLHGIIVAHAYGIPAAWVRFSNLLDGDDTKFRDHAAAVGVSLPPYKSPEKAEPVLGTLDTGPLMKALEAIR